MNLPSDSHMLESVWSLNGSYNNVYGSTSSNFCEVDFRLIKEATLVVYKGLNVNDEAVIEEEVESDETDVIQIDMLNKPEYTGNLQQIKVLKGQKIVEIEPMEIDNLEDEQENTNHLQQIEVLRQEKMAENKAIEIDNVEPEKEVHDFNQDGLTEEYDSDPDENNSQLTADAASKFAELTKTSGVLIKLAGFDQTFAIILGLSILFSTFVVIYHLRRTKSSTPVSKTVAEKQEIKIRNLEHVPSEESTEPSLNIDSLQIEGSKEISYIHAPSVELLGEFVFEEEATNSVKSYKISVSAEDDTSNSLIQPATVSSIRSKLSHMEMSTGDSHTIKKQKGKNSEVLGCSSMFTPVRRSSRIRNRSVTSP